MSPSGRHVFQSHRADATPHRANPTPLSHIPLRCLPLPDTNKVLTTTVELEGRLQRNALLGRRSLCVRLFSSVQSVDIGLVVLLVVKLHDLPRDERLEGVVGVGEVGESVLARHVVDFCAVGENQEGERKVEVGESRYLSVLIEEQINNAIQPRQE